MAGYQISPYPSPSQLMNLKTPTPKCFSYKSFPSNKVRTSNLSLPDQSISETTSNITSAKPLHFNLAHTPNHLLN